MTIRISHQRVVNDVEVGSEQHFERFAIERMQIELLFLQSLSLQKFGEQILDFIEVLHVKKVEVLGRGFQDFGDRLIVEQQVNAVHALDQKMFDLI
jgi:hypothetical protein